MTGLFICITLAAAGAVIAGVSSYFGVKSVRGYMGWDIGWVLAATLGWLMLLVFGIIAIAVPASASYDETVCRNYGEATNRETQFIHTGFFSWECQVQTDEGWVSTDQIIKVDE